MTTDRIESVLEHRDKCRGCGRCTKTAEEDDGTDITDHELDYGFDDRDGK